MLQSFIINGDGLANLKDNLKGEPVFKVKSTLTLANVKNVSGQREQYDKKLKEWLKTINSYKVIGWKKDSGIESHKDIIGKECIGELTAGTVFIHSIVQ